MKIENLQQLIAEAAMATGTPVSLTLTGHVYVLESGAIREPFSALPLAIRRLNKLKLQGTERSKKAHEVRLKAEHLLAEARALGVTLAIKVDDEPVV